MKKSEERAKLPQILTNSISSQLLHKPASQSLKIKPRAGTSLDNKVHQPLPAHGILMNKKASAALIVKPTLHAYSTPQIEYDIREPASAEQAKQYHSFANQVINSKVSSNVKKQKKLLHQYAIPMKNNTFYSYNSHRGAPTAAQR